MEQQPGLLNLFSERLLVTGGLDLLNEAMTQAALFVEKSMSVSETKVKIKEKMKNLEFFYKIAFRK